MNNFEEKYVGERSYQNHNHIGRFDTALAAVREQIEIETIPAQYRARAEELAQIIAGVFILDPNCEFCFGKNKEKLSASALSEIYKKIDRDRVIEVIRRFNKITYEIKDPTAYKRSMLYRIVFDFEAKTENEVNVAMPHLAGGGAADD